jgi:glycosyltransferase involved in cell wall biosynthesis
MLSIIVITMNRGEQLKSALNSCLQSILPDNTEFIIIDNNSTDNTKSIVKEILENSKYDYVYKRMEENKGVGGGRNEGFSNAQGKYNYFLDDDAVIAEDSREDFFKKTINYLEENPKVATLTTRITDLALKRDRVPVLSKINKENDGKTVFMYMGGSHFLRRECFDSPLYFDIKYGYEELRPSINVYNNDLSNIYCDSVRILHCPKVDKWGKKGNANEIILIAECAIPYATKRILYPRVLLPVLFLSYKIRSFKYLRNYRGACNKSDELAKEIISSNSEKRVKLKTVIKGIREFGLTVI